MVTFTINIPPMLPYIAYMDPMGDGNLIWWEIPAIDDGYQIHQFYPIMGFISILMGPSPIKSNVAIHNSPLMNFHWNLHPLVGDFPAMFDEGKPRYVGIQNDGWMVKTWGFSKPASCLECPWWDEHDHVHLVHGCWWIYDHNWKDPTIISWCVNPSNCRYI